MHHAQPARSQPGCVCQVQQLHQSPGVVNEADPPPRPDQPLGNSQEIFQGGTRFVAGQVPPGPWTYATFAAATKIDSVGLIPGYDKIDPISLACRATGMDLMVRIRKHGYDSVMRALEFGANGIMVPHCRSADEARQWVDRYADAGYVQIKIYSSVDPKLVPAIIAEASLSFLGLGQQPPEPSWGSMLNTAKNYIDNAPWMAVWPGLSIFVLVLSFNLVGDGLLRGASRARVSRFGSRWATPGSSWNARDITSTARGRTSGPSWSTTRACTHRGSGTSPRQASRPR